MRLAGVPLGAAADRWSRKRLLAVGLSIWAGLTALGGLSTGYAMLFATRLGVGIGEAVCAPAATSWIGDLVPPDKRSRALAGFMMAVPVGIMISFVASGPAAQAFGWRSALLLAAAPAVVLVPMLLRLPELETLPQGNRDFRRDGAGQNPGPLVDHPVGRARQFHDVQLLLFCRRLPDALPRIVGGRSGRVVGAGIGRGRNRGRAGGGRVRRTAQARGRGGAGCGAACLGSHPVAARERDCGNRRS